MNDALAGDGFRQHTDHKPEHGGTAVETLNAFQLFGVDGMEAESWNHFRWLVGWPWIKRECLGVTDFDFFFAAFSFASESPMADRSLAMADGQGLPEALFDVVAGLVDRIRERVSTRQAGGDRC